MVVEGVAGPVRHQVPVLPMDTVVVCLIAGAGSAVRMVVEASVASVNQTRVA